MSTEKTFTVVGTAINKDGTVKVRWANDLVARIKILDKAGCTEINLMELDEPMTKLAAAEYYLANANDISPAAREILESKVAEKTKMAKRAGVKATITKNVDKRIQDKAPTDPRVEKFIEQVEAEAAE